MARHYTRVLSEDTLKGMTQKAKSGLYPSAAPHGYRNVEGPDGRRIIVPNSDAPTITKLFEEFATGEYSVKALAAKTRSEGRSIGGKPLPKSNLHQILRRRLYSGDFDYGGTTYTGKHEPLVTHELWEKVQTLLGRRPQTKKGRVKHDFAYTDLVRCGHCDCVLVGELKKGKYVYYHCTGYRGKCGEPYTREELLEKSLCAALKEIVVPTGVLNWLQEAVSSSDLTEHAAREGEEGGYNSNNGGTTLRFEAIYRERHHHVEQS